MANIETRTYEVKGRWSNVIIAGGQVADVTLRTWYDAVDEQHTRTLAERHGIRVSKISLASEEERGGVS